MTAERRAALVERMARAIAKNDDCPWEFFLEASSAALDLALEEVAKVAEGCELYNERDQLLHSDARATCAAAIRALKGK